MNIDQSTELGAIANKKHRKEYRIVALSGRELVKMAWGATVLLITSLGIIAAGCGRSTSTSAGGTSLHQQVERAQNVSDPARRARRLIQLALRQDRAKDTGGAKRTLGLASDACDLVSDPAGRAGLLTLLAKAQARVGDSGASGAADRALQATAEIDDAQTRLIALARMAEAQAAVGALQQAVDTLADVENDAEQLDDVAGRVRVLCRAAESYDHSRVGRPAEADRVIATSLVLAQTIADDRDRSQAIAEVATAQASMKRSAAGATQQLALEAARQVKSDWSKAHSLHSIAVKMPNAAAARKVLLEAETVAARVPEPDLKKQTLEMIRQSMDGLRRPRR